MSPIESSLEVPHQPLTAAEEYAALGALPLEPLADGAYARSVVLAQGGCYEQARTAYDGLATRFPVAFALAYHQVLALVDEAKRWFQMDALGRCEEVLVRASNILDEVEQGPVARAWEPVLELLVHMWIQREQPLRALEVATELRSRCGTQASAPLMAWCLVLLDRPVEARQWTAQLSPDQQKTSLGRLLMTLAKGAQSL